MASCLLHEVIERPDDSPKCGLPGNTLSESFHMCRFEKPAGESPVVRAQHSPAFAVGMVESGGIHNPALAVESLRLLLAPAIDFAPDALVEITIEPHYGSPVYLHHRAQDVEQIIADVNLLGRSASAVRINLNPLQSNLCGPTATAADVARVCWIAVNINGKDKRWPYRNADHRERFRTELLSNDVRLSLRNQYAWQEPLVLFTGNGINQLFRVDLSPVDAAKIVPAVLASLHDHFGRVKGAEIDYRSTSRLDFRVRLPGTLNGKGTVSTLNRPAMRCSIDPIRSPEVVEVVPPSLLMKAMEHQWDETRPPRGLPVAPWSAAAKGGAI